MKQIVVHAFVIPLLISATSFAATTDIYHGYIPQFRYDGTESPNSKSCTVFLTDIGNNNFRVFAASNNNNGYSHREFFFNPVEKTTEYDGYISSEHRMGMVQGSFLQEDNRMIFDFRIYSLELTTSNDKLTALYYKEGNDNEKKVICSHLRYIKTVDGEGYYGTGNYYKPDPTYN